MKSWHKKLSKFMQVYKLNIRSVSPNLHGYRFENLRTNLMCEERKMKETCGSSSFFLFFYSSSIFFFSANDKRTCTSYFWQIARSPKEHQNYFKTYGNRGNSSPLNFLLSQGLDFIFSLPIHYEIITDSPKGSRKYLTGKSFGH